MVETIAITVSTLLVALIFPAYAEKIFAVTGATAVCIVCYVIPVGLHLKLQSLEQSQLPALDLIQQEDREVHALLLPDGEQDTYDVHVALSNSQQDAQADTAQHSSRLSEFWRTTQQIVLPVLVVVVGVSLSLAALFTTCRPWFS